MLVELLRVTTRDGYLLDGILMRSLAEKRIKLDAVCFIHGTGGNFYGSSLFEVFAQNFLDLGCPVLRVNTRGHDGISTAVTAHGGRRLGAAFETVDDCRHDLAAWLDWMRANLGPRVALLGHSLGAVKCLYAAAQEPGIAPHGIIAISPPRLSYSWFCSGARCAEFLETYQAAEAHVRAGHAGALMEVNLPLPLIITAAAYVEKYGPDERYNYLQFLTKVPCPTLVLVGSMEADNNIAFQETPAELARLAEQHAHLAVATITGADHFYNGVRAEAWQAIATWLTPMRTVASKT